VGPSAHRLPAPPASGGGRTVPLKRPRFHALSSSREEAAVTDWKRIFAIVEVVGEPEETNPGERWPWTVAVDPLIVIPILEHAPPIEAIGVPARSTSRQSHIRLSPEHYARAVDVIGSVAH
jgi:hypothetical protein